MVTTGRTISPRPLTEQEKRAVIAMQAHLRCEDHAARQGDPGPDGSPDRRGPEGLPAPAHARGQLEDRCSTRAPCCWATAASTTSGCCCACCASAIVDATGLLEDGSALGVQGQVQGRVLDSPEFQPLAVPADKAPSSAPPAAAGPRRRRQAAPRRRQQPAAAADASAKIVPAPDLIAAGHAGGQRGAGLDVTGGRRSRARCRRRRRRRDEEGARRPRKGPGAAADGRRDQAAAAAAVPRPEDGAARGDRSRRRGAGAAEARQGRTQEVEAARRRPPDADAVREGGRPRGRARAAGRPPSAAGRRSRRRTARMALKYKESVTGDAAVARGAGHADLAPGAGHAHQAGCSSSVGDTFEPKTEIIGPGYRAAYGLVAIVHHQIMERNEKGEPQLMDLRIRTHGTPGYRSVKRGESNGCHRLHNYEALRLAAFLVKHHENVRDGLVPEDYVRNLDVQGPEGRPREREQGLPLQADAAHPGDRPRRRRQGRRQGRQAHGAAGRGAVARLRAVPLARLGLRHGSDWSGLWSCGGAAGGWLRLPESSRSGHDGDGRKGGTGTGGRASGGTSGWGSGRAARGASPACPGRAVVALAARSARAAAAWAARPVRALAGRPARAVARRRRGSDGCPSRARRRFRPDSVCRATRATTSAVVATRPRAARPASPWRAGTTHLV